MAGLVHRPLGMTFRDVASWMSRAYAARSKYVHEGRRVESELMIQQAKAICRQVLYSLLRVQHNQQDRVITIQQWLRLIDFIVATYEAGRDASEVDLAEIGVS